MSELQHSLEALHRRLDRMGLAVAGALDRALAAVEKRDVQAGQHVDDDDQYIDREEVAIEQECVNLLALYQPAAVDLRRIFFIIKVNNDLERIADIAGRIGRRVAYLVGWEVRLADWPEYAPLTLATKNILSLTVGMINTIDTGLPRRVIEADRQVDEAYGDIAEAILARARAGELDADGALTLMILARSLERVGDHCTNIAEDAHFFVTGQIIRHSPISRYKP